MAHKPNPTLSVFVNFEWNTVILNLFIYCLFLLLCSNSSSCWIATTETMWSTKLKYSVSGPLKEKFSDPCSKNIRNPIFPSHKTPKLHILETHLLMEKCKGFKKPAHLLQLTWCCVRFLQVEDSQGGPFPMKNPSALIGNQANMQWDRFLCQWSEQMAGATLRPCGLLFFSIWPSAPLHRKVDFEQRPSVVLHFTSRSVGEYWVPPKGWGLPYRESFSDVSGNEVGGVMG